jgi:ABC-type uncharacterized transport system involved in gliding motility auxiliary subunit
VALMAEQTPTIDRGARGLIFTGAYLFAMVLVYIGERLVFDKPPWRIGLAACAAGLMAVAIGGRIWRMRQIGKIAPPVVERRLVMTYAVGIIALVLYLMQADFVMEWLRPMFGEPRTADRYVVVMQVAWVVVWLSAIVPLVFVELSYGTMDTARTVELNRITRSAASGLIIAMVASAVFALNYVASELNEKKDLSYFKTTRPSESSKKMVQNLNDTFEVVLFFGSTNEVLPEARSYFDELDKASDKLTVRVVDHVLEPKLAKELGASDNGTVVFRHKKSNRQLVLGQKIGRARSKLKKLDSEFQNAFLRLARSRKIAYLTVGHEERAQKDSDRAKQEKIDDLRATLRKLNYTVKDLGLSQGLASEIPADATFVLIAGPRKPFMEAESKALKRYLEGGGRAMVLLDPENGVTMDGLLNPFGLQYNATPLAVTRPIARMTFTKADRHLIVSNRFGVHTSVNTLSRNSNQLAVLMHGTGFLEEVPPSGPQKPKVQFTVHSMALTWNDVNGNFEFDKDSEKRKSYELAAAVTLKIDPAKAAKRPAADEDGASPEMRLVVVGDSDIVSDGLLFSRALGNRYLLLDAIKWLGGEEKFIGETTSEEDVRIAHTRKGDEIWFYLTIFGIPALVLGAGVWHTKRRRRRR